MKVIRVIREIRGKKIFAEIGVHSPASSAFRVFCVFRGLNQSEFRELRLKFYNRAPRQNW